MFQIKFYILLITLSFSLNLGANQKIQREAMSSSVSEISSRKELRSVKGKDIEVIRVPAMNPDGKILKPKHRFYIQGGLHGDEVQTTAFVTWLASQVIEGTSLLNQFPKNEVAFDFVPVANPDGLAAEKRYNSNATNLNRNFSYLWGLTSENPGKEQFSEPETKAIKYLLDSNKYTAAVDVHGYINWIVAPSAPSENSGISRSAYQKWIAALKKNIKNFDPTYKLKTAAGLGDGGAFEDYAFWEAGAFSFCLEMASAFRNVYQPNGKDVEKVDLFRKYEQMIYASFKDAVDIKGPDRALSAR